MSSSSVLIDSSLLSRLDRLLFRLETALALVGGLAVLALMLLAVISASGRNFFNHSLPGYVDWIEVAMPFIAVLGIAYCHRLGGHIRMDLLIGRMGGRPLWLAEWTTTLLMLVFAVLMTWGAWSHFDRSFDWASPNWSRDSTLDIGLPLWPAKLVVPLALSLLSMRLLLHLLAYGRALRGGATRPVAVPLMVDVAEQAAQEAESLLGAKMGQGTDQGTNAANTTAQKPQSHKPQQGG